MYTTVKGKKLELTPALWRGINHVARGRFDGSVRLFESCWRDYRNHVNGAIDDPTCIEDVMDWLDSIASDKVNNSNSKFYIYG